jgi:predicted nuclease of restriction endonuclease-like RecB superfamily
LADRTLPHREPPYREQPSAELTPRYLVASDYPWLRALLDETRRFAGRRQAELDERLAEPLPTEAPRDKLRFAVRALRRVVKTRTSSPVPPAAARRTLFRAAADGGGRAEALAKASEELRASPDELEAALFADLPAERIVADIDEMLGPAELAQHSNLLLVGDLLKRATEIEVSAEGNIRGLVQQAKLRGLLCTVCAESDRHRARLHVSGPYALFRRTTLYGRALSSLIPRAVWCHRVEIRARCVLGADASLRTLIIRSGDPILPAREPRPYDSKLERRFARDFARIARDWDVIREPEPLASNGTLIFPDFVLRHRRAPERAWLLEIMGFWTPGYVAQKLERLRDLHLDRFVLCIDDERNCGEGDLPAGASVIRFRRKIDPEAVLRLVDPGRC